MGTVFGYRNGVLEVGGGGSIPGDNGPSGLPAVNSACAASAPFVVDAYIAVAGTHIVSFPAIFTAAVASAASVA